MKAAAFEYHAPRTLTEATELLARHVGADVRVLAGGQSLVPAMAFRIATPAHLIDINQIGELSSLRVEQAHLVVGACVRHNAFEQPTRFVRAARCAEALQMPIHRPSGVWSLRRSARNLPHSAAGDREPFNRPIGSRV